MRRAQVEVMGLVIVVVLVVIGLFFSLALRSPTTTRPLSNVYSDETLAADFLITFLETTEPSCGQSMRDIAIDCVRSSQMNVNRYYCQGKPSCEFINSVLVDITGRTLDPWGISYLLTFTYKLGEESTELARLDTTGCTDDRDREAPGIQPIPLYGAAPGSAALRLEICN